MASLNECSFIGNLGKDPEIKVMQSGKKKATFSIACSDTWKDETTGEKKEHTEWIPCSCFEPLANVVEQYIKKGSKVFVRGQYKTRSWDDPSTGAKRYATDINVDKLIMLDSRPAGQAGHTQGQAEYNAPSTASDDCPF